MKYNFSLLPLQGISDRFETADKDGSHIYELVATEVVCSHSEISATITLRKSVRVTKTVRCGFLWLKQQTTTEYETVWEIGGRKCLIPINTDPKRNLNLEGRDDPRKLAIELGFTIGPEILDTLFSDVEKKLIALAS